MRLQTPFLNHKSLEALVGILVQWFKELTDRTNERMPPGGLILWKNSATVPVGWLAANGATVNSEQYPELAAYMGATGATFALPAPGSPAAGYDWIVAI